MYFEYFIFKCFAVWLIHIYPYHSKKFTYFIHTKTGIKLQNSSIVMNFIDVTHFTIHVSELGLYSLQRALSCRNMLKWSDSIAFRWFIKWKYLEEDVQNEICSAVFVVKMQCTIREYSIFSSVGCTANPLGTRVLRYVRQNHVKQYSVTWM